MAKAKSHSIDFSVSGKVFDCGEGFTYISRRTVDVAIESIQSLIFDPISEAPEDLSELLWELDSDRFETFFIELTRDDKSRQTRLEVLNEFGEFITFVLNLQPSFYSEKTTKSIKENYDIIRKRIEKYSMFTVLADDVDINIYQLGLQRWSAKNAQPPAQSIKQKRGSSVEIYQSRLTQLELVDDLSQKNNFYAAAALESNRKPKGITYGLIEENTRLLHKLETMALIETNTA